MCRSMIEWQRGEKDRKTSDTHTHTQNKTHKRNLQHMISQRTVSTVNDGF